MYVQLIVCDVCDVCVGRDSRGRLCSLIKMCNPYEIRAIGGLGFSREALARLRVCRLELSQREWSRLHACALGGRPPTNRPTRTTPSLNQDETYDETNACIIKDVTVGQHMADRRAAADGWVPLVEAVTRTRCKTNVWSRATSTPPTGSWTQHGQEVTVDVRAYGEGTWVPPWTTADYWS